MFQIYLTNQSGPLNTLFMAKMTPQQIAVAAAKRAASIAARKANGGMTVRQARAAAKAAKAAASTASYTSTSTTSYNVPPQTPPQAPPPPPKPQAPAFRKRGGYTQPAPTYRGVKLVALAAIEDTFILKLKETGVTQDARDAYAKYQKLKALALGSVTNSATQNEADAALRMAVLHLVKLAF